MPEIIHDDRLRTASGVDFLVNITEADMRTQLISIN